jgi:hypothetical protein
MSLLFLLILSMALTSNLRFRLCTVAIGVLSLSASVTVALRVLSVGASPTWPCECYWDLSALCPCSSELLLLFLLILSMSPTSNLRCRLCTVAMVGVLLLSACHGHSYGVLGERLVDLAT